MASSSSSSSSLPPPISSDDSFHTAEDSNLAKETAASSPVQSFPCPYQDARQLPRDLREHCAIYLEERLFAPAIRMLSINFAAGRSRRVPNQKGFLIPPPSHLALLNTVTVHPVHTTRADKPESGRISSQALSYLRDVLTVVGPLHADLKRAFTFERPTRLGGRVGHARFSMDGDSSYDSDGDSDGDSDRLRCSLAEEAGLWQRGQDFWSVVGWALKCSTLHPKRWKHWAVWLDFMIDVMQADWYERDRRDVEDLQASGGALKDTPTTFREGSILFMYMKSDGDRVNFKRILKAIMADGNSVTSASFREVFDNELRGPRRNNKRKREMVDLENDKYGDYFDEDPMSSGDDEPSTPQKPRETRKTVSGIPQAGFVESVPLRLRLFGLISLAVFTLDNDEIVDLYEEYTSALLALPLQSFFILTSERPNDLTVDAQVTLTKLLFERLVPSTRRSPSRVDKQADKEGRLTSKMLEECYIIHAANTIALEDNVKLSLVVEKAILLLSKCGALDFTESFKAAVEKGIAAREARVKRKRAGKAKGADSGEAAALEKLLNSHERIRIVMETIGSFGVEMCTD